MKMKSHFPAAVALISLLITGCAAENTAKEAKVNEAVVLKSNTLRGLVLQEYFQLEDILKNRFGRFYAESESA